MRNDPQYKDYEIIVGGIEDQMNDDPGLAFLSNSQRINILTSGHDLPSKDSMKLLILNCLPELIEQNRITLRLLIIRTLIMRII